MKSNRKPNLYQWGFLLVRAMRSTMMRSPMAFLFSINGIIFVA